MMDYPKLRYGLEAFPVEHEGQRMVLLRDRIGFCEAPLLVSPLVAELLMQMNGHNSLRDLQAHYVRRTGDLLFSEKLEAILKMLDDHLFLENENFLRRAGEEVDRYLQDPIRRMQYAGKSYPADAEILSQQLQSFFQPDCGEHGAPGGVDNCRLVGLMAPHIDIQAGGPCFAYAYKALQETIPPEVWVILGTGHEPLENHFALTLKDFETPIGIVQYDHEFCEELIRRAPRDLRASEYNHHREHTIEFQAVFLAFSQPQARIVPLLCSLSLE
ncbi:MAG: AmmeMemoRadiSam system protein B, partial [Desulforhabdus sp.]|nr:AmmeMemoRadiSam system protein B [Desulforhabdus sp.]